MFTSDIIGGKVPSDITGVPGDVTGVWLRLKPPLTSNKRSNHVWLWNLLLLVSATAPAGSFLGSVSAYRWDKDNFYMHDSHVNITKTNNGILFPTSLTTQKATVIENTVSSVPSGHRGKGFAISLNHVSQSLKMAAHDHSRRQQANLWFPCLPASNYLWKPCISLGTSPSSLFVLPTDADIQTAWSWAKS